MVTSPVHVHPDQSAVRKNVTACRRIWSDPVREVRYWRCVFVKEAVAGPIEQALHWLETAYDDHILGGRTPARGIIDLALAHPVARLGVDEKLAPNVVSL